MTDSLLQMLGTPLFDARARHTLPLRDYMDLTIRRLRHIMQSGLITNDMWLGQPRGKEFRQLNENLAIVAAFDYALYSSIVDHLIACNALVAHGNAQQVSRYREEIIELRAVYSFGCTEIRSGSDVSNLQTTVTHDPQNACLILNTPDPSACKFWIGNALHAAQVVMVLARLIVDGRDEGLHWFRVHIRNKENGPLLAGVNVMACDPKGGIHANQVAGICFSQMILPTDALMQRHSRFTAEGTFTSDVPREQRATSAMETFIQERVLLLAAARGSAGLCSWLAHRFVIHRKTAAAGQTLLNKPPVRQRLYEEQLKALALQLMEQAVMRRFEAQWDQLDKRKELHMLAAVAKSVGTWMGLDVMRKCRELCGSQGFHHYNQIVTHTVDGEISVTFAGDNSLMAILVAMNAVTRPRFASRPTSNIAQQIEKNIVEQCRNPGEISHRQAVAIVHARALDLVLDEAGRDPRMSASMLKDLIGVFEPSLREGELPVDRVDVNRATPERLARLTDWLKPPKELVATAPIAGADYIKQMTKPLYPIEEKEQALLDFTDLDTVRTPYPSYAYLREHHPVYWSAHFKAWFLTRYDDVLAAQGDSIRYSSDRMQQLVDAQLPPDKREQLKPFVKLASEWMYSQDGDMHKASRHLLGKAFTPRVIESLRQIIQEITDREIDELEPQTDLMAKLFNRVPALILAHLYGIPREDALKLRNWTDDILIFLVGSLDPDYGPEQALKGVEEMYAYFASLIEKRREHPEDDLVSHVLEASIDSDSSVDAVLAQIVFILVAGYTTSADQLCIGLLHLLEHPEQVAALRADPGLIKSAVEEMLRYDAAGSFSHRVLMEDVTLHGVTMRKGDLVYLMRGCANRDPAKFPDPDRFDIRRKDNKHLAFGIGGHFCMGTALFRLEAEIVFSTLFKRYPQLSLIAGKPAIWRTNNLQFRGLKSLPIDLGQGVAQ